MAFVALAALYANGANPEDLAPFFAAAYENIKGFLPLLADAGA